LVKAFVKDLAGFYPHITVSYVGGDPRIVFTENVKFTCTETKSEDEIHENSYVEGFPEGEVILNHMNTEEIENLVKARGILPLHKNEDHDRVEDL